MAELTRSPQSIVRLYGERRGEQILAATDAAPGRVWDLIERLRPRADWTPALRPACAGGKSDTRTYVDALLLRLLRRVDAGATSRGFLGMGWAPVTHGMVDCQGCSPLFKASATCCVTRWY